ncbi:MAG: ATP synthase F1 subunit delta [Chloracidobacterium sp.]|nr:ATP synthase F1 subunit delta [Chloracidobacterium sp.]MDW8216121.1 ATP synthase F1 subunit delta [Acidobacteriota bacterium]
MTSLANRYARAVADAAGADFPTVVEEVKTFHQLMTSHAELTEALTNPTIPLDQKERFLRALCARLKPHPTTTNFLMVVLRHQRMAVLGDIQKALEALLDARSGVVAVEVASAKPLSVRERRALEERLRKLVGGDIRLTYKEAPELLGGVVACVGSTYYDGSIRTQLAEIRERLTRRY